MAAMDKPEHNHDYEKSRGMNFDGCPACYYNWGVSEGWTRGFSEGFDKGYKTCMDEDNNDQFLR